MSYRLLTYAVGQAARAGVLVGGHVYDAARASGVASYATVLGVLADWTKAHRVLRQAAKRIAAGRSRAKGIPIARAKLLAPVLYPGEVFCAGANYTDHVEEMARSHGRPPEPDPRSQGLHPWHFVKTARASIVGPRAAVKLPAYSQAIDWEIELAAVIGRPARNVPVARALEYVAGYTIANDLSARDVFLRKPVPEFSPFKWDWVSQKCFEGACPLGPWITPADEIPDPQRLALKLWIDGELMQDSNTARMIFSTAEQIAHLSTRVTLAPGDLVLTGTPAGVGFARHRFLKAGETVKLWIEGVGEFQHRLA